MSSYNGWLPPLISHGPHQIHTTVEITQSKPHDNHRRPPDEPVGIPTLAVCLEASVDFVSNNENQSSFNGLLIDDTIEIPCLLSFDDILDRYPYLKVSGAGRVTWKEMLHKGEESCFELLNPGIGEKVDKTFEMFLKRMMQQEMYKYHVVDLVIKKEIAIPEEDLKSWQTWYDAKSLSDPGFSSDFDEAISRPRTIEQLSSETVNWRAELNGRLAFETVEVDGAINEHSCRICLEFPIGAKAGRLSCSHVFHQGCLNKWLQQSNACPICRFNVLSTDHVPMMQED